MIRMKKHTPAAAAALILIAFLAGRSPALKPQERILVLGFDSKLLNDIQDRLLRETVMRGFHVSGVPVVPVMEIESIFHEDQKRQIRKLKRDEMKSLCEELGAGYACCGSIMPDGGGAGEEIRSGKTYICALTLFIRGKNRFQEIRVTMAGEDNLYRFSATLSKVIVSEIKKLL